MADFPDSVYEPRTKENQEGVVYDAERSTIGYAEDITYLDAEVVAIETILGTNPEGEAETVGERIADLESSVAQNVLALSDGATPALDASLGNIFTLAAAGNRTIAVPSNATSGQKIVIRHLASGGARTLALNTGAGGFRFGTDITELTETASGKTDYIGAIYNAADSKWDVVAYTKGF